MRRRGSITTTLGITTRQLGGTSRVIRSECLAGSPHMRMSMETRSHEPMHLAFSEWTMSGQLSTLPLEAGPRVRERLMAGLDLGMAFLVRLHLATTRLQTFDNDSMVATPSTRVQARTSGLGWLVRSKERSLGLVA